MANKKELRYIRKRKQIISIMVQVKATYEDWRNDVYTETTLDENECKPAAEKILSKFGINKPKSLGNL